MQVVERLHRRFVEEGLSSTLAHSIKYVYQTRIRHRLPRTTTLYNGVRVRGATPFDTFIPHFNAEKPDYEDATVSALRENVVQGDSVVVIGGGWGVSSVVAAKQAGDDGDVVVYEPGDKEISYIRDTVSLNGVENVDIRHAKVGSSGRIGLIDSLQKTTAPDDRKPNRTAESVPPENIPDCDVLEIDAEGAECEILPNLTVTPRCIVVETHANLGCSKGDVRTILRGMDYEIVQEGVESEEDGAFILTAKKDQDEK